MHITREQLKTITNEDYYSGAQIHSRFAYKFFRKDIKPLGNIVAFIAPMLVEAENLIDLEDALANDFIYSDSAINFLIELPNYSIEAGICFQRLFNTALGSLLASKYLGDNITVNVDGDDIMVCDGIHEDKKASVSIAKYDNGAVLIHTGINIDAGDKAPSFAYSTRLGKVETEQFINEAIAIFNNMTADIFVATTKLIS
jgi:hypothetical protein